MSARNATTRPGTLTVDARDNSGFRYAAVLDTEGVELALDQRRRFVLLEAELGAPVDCAPQLDDPRGQRFVYFDGHCKRS